MKYLQISLLLGTIFLSSCGIQSLPQNSNKVEAAWAEVMNQYKRRSDLIQNLVNTVKGYASHEKETFQSVIEARALATKTTINADQLNPETLKKFNQAQSGLAGALSRLMMVSERYPDLKANQNFRDLQVQIEGTENRIAIARRRYIEVVNIYNNLVTVPPTSWFNDMFWHYKKKPQFTVANEAEVQEAPKVEF